MRKRKAPPDIYGTVATEPRRPSSAWRRSVGGTWFRVVGTEQHSVRRGRDGRYRWEVRRGIDRGGQHEVEVSLASYDTEAEAVADLLASLAERGWRGVA